MNYLKVYCNLIRKAENRTPPKGYTEKHHIFPLSVYGKNNRVVPLTAKEHYIAHALLEKICIQRYGLDHWKTKKMTLAFWFMNNGKRMYYNSNLYENARIRFNTIPDKKHTEETIEKLRQRGLNRSEEYKKKMSEVKKGTPVSEETRKKISESLKGRTPIHSPKGTTLSAEHREKISKTLKGRAKSEETKSKMSASKKGIPKSEETKAKMREAHKKRRASTTSPDT